MVMFRRVPAQLTVRHLLQWFPESMRQKKRWKERENLLDLLEEKSWAELWRNLSDTTWLCWFIILKYYELKVMIDICRSTSWLTSCFSFQVLEMVWNHLATLTFWALSILCSVVKMECFWLRGFGNSSCSCLSDFEQLSPSSWPRQTRLFWQKSILF